MCKVYSLSSLCIFHLELFSKLFMTICLRTIFMFSVLIYIFGWSIMYWWRVSVLYTSLVGVLCIDDVCPSCTHLWLEYYVLMTCVRLVHILTEQKLLTCTNICTLLYNTDNIYTHMCINIKRTISIIHFKLNTRVHIELSH